MEPRMPSSFKSTALAIVACNSFIQPWAVHHAIGMFSHSSGRSIGFGSRMYTTSTSRTSPLAKGTGFNEGIGSSTPGSSTRRVPNRKNNTPTRKWNTVKRANTNNQYASSESNLTMSFTKRNGTPTANQLEILDPASRADRMKYARYSPTHFHPAPVVLVERRPKHNAMLAKPKANAAHPTNTTIGNHGDTPPNSGRTISTGVTAKIGSRIFGRLPKTSPPMISRLRRSVARSRSHCFICLSWITSPHITFSVSRAT